MKSEIFVQIALLLIALVGMIISTYVIPWLSSKTEGIELEKLMNYTKKAVEWANQTIPSEEWKRKKEEVTALVIAYMTNNLKIQLSEKDVDVIIEALVNEAKKVLKV